MGKMNPYYDKYVQQHKLDDGVELVILPLCDGSHFYGYIIDLKNRSIVYVDSLYEAKKKGRRSIANILKEKYFGDSEPVRFTSYFKKRVQTDSYTCGAWLIAGFVGYSLDLSAENYIM